MPVFVGWDRKWSPSFLKEEEEFCWLLSAEKSTKEKCGQRKTFPLSLSSHAVRKRCVGRKKEWLWTLKRERARDNGEMVPT